MAAPTEPHGPTRTCVGCRTRRPADELHRLALVGGAVVFSRRAPGRGAWLCADQLERCADLAVRRRAFDRAFRTRVDPGALEL